MFGAGLQGTAAHGPTLLLIAALLFLQSLETSWQRAPTAMAPHLTSWERDNMGYSQQTDLKRKLPSVREGEMGEEAACSKWDRTDMFVTPAVSETQQASNKKIFILIQQNRREKEMGKKKKKTSQPFFFL